MRRALTLGLVLIATAVSATELELATLAAAAGSAELTTATTRARESLGQKTQWAPSGNFSALHGRAVFRSEFRSESRPYARARGEVAAGIGIFLSRDSKGASSYLSTPNGLGPWSYAGLNPARKTDPDGRRDQYPIETEFITYLRDLADAKDLAPTSDFQQFLEANYFFARSESRMLRRYADNWATAIYAAPPGVPVVARHSGRWIEIDDGEGGTLQLDPLARFQSLGEYELEEDADELEEYLENGPSNSPFSQLSTSFGPGAKRGAAPNRQYRSPGTRSGTRISGKRNSAKFKKNLKQLQQGKPVKSGKTKGKELPSEEQLIEVALRDPEGYLELTPSRATRPPLEDSRFYVGKKHMNSNDYDGPVDVYYTVAKRDQTLPNGGSVKKGQLLHFGETARGTKVRGEEWAAYFKSAYGIDTISEKNNHQGREVGSSRPRTQPHQSLRRLPRRTTGFQRQLGLDCHSASRPLR